MLPKLDRCTGCGACAAVCPIDCIRMTGDTAGFLYPQVDQNRCLHCNSCERSCPVLQPPQVAESVEISAAQNTDAAIRQESSSGGVFTALAQMMIRSGGTVCAAVYNQEFGVEHRIAFTMEELAPMRGAKYAQSHAGHLFRQLKELLAGGTPVMFVGTPCQCAALRSYLGKDDANLLLVDMICHGVPAPAVWEAYVQRRRQLDADGQPVASINLRDKSTGWSKYAYSVLFRYPNGDVYCVPQGKDPYMRGFVGDLYLRPACSQCSFKGILRCSDLTLGDCWGIWDSHPDFDDNKGTSLLLIQSKAGQEMWDKVRHGFCCVALTVEDVTGYNPSAVSASAAHDARSAFFQRFEAGEPVDELIPDILSPKPPEASRIKRILRKLLPRR